MIMSVKGGWICGGDERYYPILPTHIIIKSFLIPLPTSIYREKNKKELI